MPNPTILLVPGSFAGRGLYQPIIDKLRAKGCPALVIDLPSTQKRAGFSPATMQEDAAHIRSVAEALISQGKEVVVVCHSYGGTPTTEALAALGVKRIVYLTAVVPRVGESLRMAYKGLEDAFNSAVDGYMHGDAITVASGISNDLPSWEEAYECALQLPHHSAVSFEGIVTKAAYESLPVSYILCEKDYILSPETQRRFIGVLEEVQGKKIDVVSLDSGHCPNWSQPDKLVEVLIKEAQK